MPSEYVLRGAVGRVLEPERRQRFRAPATSSSGGRAGRSCRGLRTPWRARRPPRTGRTGRCGGAPRAGGVRGTSTPAMAGLRTRLQQRPRGWMTVVSPALLRRGLSTEKAGGYGEVDAVQRRDVLVLLTSPVAVIGSAPRRRRVSPPIRPVSNCTGRADPGRGARSGGRRGAGDLGAARASRLVTSRAAGTRPDLDVRARQSSPSGWALLVAAGDSTVSPGGPRAPCPWSPSRLADGDRVRRALADGSPGPSTRPPTLGALQTARGQHAPRRARRSSSRRDGGYPRLGGLSTCRSSAGVHDARASSAARPARGTAPRATRRRQWRGTAGPTSRMLHRASRMRCRWPVPARGSCAASRGGRGAARLGRPEEALDLATTAGRDRARRREDARSRASCAFQASGGGGPTDALRTFGVRDVPADGSRRPTT